MTAPRDDTTKARYDRSDRPCPVCGGHTKGCSRTADEAIRCRIGPVAPDAWDCLSQPGESSSGFGLFRRHDDRLPTVPRRGRSAARPVGTAPAARPATPPWRRYVDQLRAGLTPYRRQQWAGLLGVGVEALAHADLGCVPAGQKVPGEKKPRVDDTLTIAERDGDGAICGISLRSPNGRKGQVKGSQRGLVLPDCWRERLVRERLLPLDPKADRRRVLAICEGGSDTLLATDVGVPAVGRANNTHGAVELGKLLADLPLTDAAGDPIQIIVVGDNDEPGVTGSATLAAKLAERLNRPVAHATPADGAKDVRELLAARLAGAGESLPAVLGRQFEQELLAQVKMAEPLLASTPADSVEESGLAIRTVSDIVAAEADWLWFDRLPLGMVTILDGDPGRGKSTIALDFASRVTTVRLMPFSPPGTAPRPPADVLILAAEDSPEHTIQPRLEAAGAVLARCHLLEGELTADGLRPVVFPRDVARIERAVVKHGVKLVVVDPLMAFIDSGVETNSDADSRQVLTALKLMAERTGAAVLLLRHLNKKSGESAMYRGGGSIAFTAAARVAMCVGPHPDDPDRQVLAVVKLNVARKPPALAYSTVDRRGVPVIAWHGEVEVDADTILAPKPKRKGEALEAASDFLRGQLADGPKCVAELKAAAEQAGINWSAMKRAKNSVGAEDRQAKAFGNQTTWGLKPPADPAPGATSLFKDEMLPD